MPASRTRRAKAGKLGSQPASRSADSGAQERRIALRGRDG